MKSERLKKLENEMKDLEKWLKLGLVPKKDLEKHNFEIESIKAKIEEEKQRLIFLKESGDMEDFTAPKRTAQKQIYEHQSIPDVGGADSQTETSFDMETTSFEADHTTLFDIEMAAGDEERDSKEYDTDEDPYSDKNRWRRSMEISDPESDDW